MNKKLIGMTAVCILSAVLTACGGESSKEEGKETQVPLETVSPESPEVTPTPDGTDEGMEEGDNLSLSLFEKSVSSLELPSLAEMPEDMFLDSYGLDPELFQSYTVQMPLMNVQATEIAVFQVKDKAEIENVRKGIEKRVAALLETWETYLPDQYELVMHYKIEEKDDFILFVIAEDSGAIVVNFMNAIK